MNTYSTEEKRGEKMYIGDDKILTDINQSILFLSGLKTHTHTHTYTHTHTHSQAWKDIHRNIQTITHTHTHTATQTHAPTNRFSNSQTNSLTQLHTVGVGKIFLTLDITNSQTHTR